jgi:secretion/DNA translocation related TadE-like protein
MVPDIPDVDDRGTDGDTRAVRTSAAETGGSGAPTDTKTVPRTGATTPGTRRDRGSATVWLLAALLVLITAGGGALAEAMTAATRQRAATAADLAALAAAADRSADPRAGCTRARTIGAANGARLIGCRVQDGIADITVAVRLPGFLTTLGSLPARARAGPPDLSG